MDFYLDAILYKTVFLPAFGQQSAQSMCPEEEEKSDHIMALTYSAGQDVKAGKKLEGKKCKRKEVEFNLAAF